MSSGPLQFADARTRAEAADAGLLGGASPKRFLPEDKNYALDETVRAVVTADVLPLVDEVRSERVQLEEEWEAIERMEALTHDSNRRYLGRSDRYLPVWHKILSTIVSNLKKGVFPSDDYMDVWSPNPERGNDAKAIKQYLQYEFDTIARLQVALKPGLRSLASHGNMVIKHGYAKQERTQGFARRALGPSLAGLEQMVHGFEKRSYCEGLRVSARNLFNWYVYPLTAPTLDEAQMVFETIDVSRHFIEQMLREKKWDEEATKALLAAGPNIDEDHQARQQKLLDTRGVNAAPSGKTTVGKFGAVYTLTEIWTYLHLPAAAYLDEDVKGAALPVRIVAVNGVVMEVRRNPYYHQRAPYEVARMNVNPGFFYGSGFGRVVRHPQYLVNDFANQTNDVGIYGLNPIALYNPGMVVGKLPSIRPGVAIPVTDPNAFKFDRPPIEQVGFGLQMVSTYLGMAQDFGSAPPIMQGVGAGRAGKTATQAQILQKNANIPLQDVVEDIEADVMVQLMRATWLNAIQYREKPVMALIAGQPVTITPEMLALPDAEFKWLASSQAMNQQMRAQQAMQFLQVAVPLAPLIMQQRKVFDPVPVLERIYRDGLGFRDFEKVVRDPTPEEMVRQAMMQAGLPEEGAPGEEPVGEGGERVRSPVEQAEGSPEQGAEPAPDSGDFMAMRGEADELAGQYGGGGPIV